MIKGFIEPNEKITSLMQSYGMEEPEAILRCDMNTDCTYGEIWLLAYKDHLVQIDAETKMKCEYDYDSIEDFHNEDFINTGQFVFKRDGESVPFAFYSNSVGRSASRFTMVVNKLRKQSLPRTISSPSATITCAPPAVSPIVTPDEKYALSA